MTQKEKQPRGAARQRASTAAQVMRLFQASSSLVAVLDPEELFATLVSRAVEALPAVQAGALWIYDAKGGRLRAGAAIGLPISAATQQALLGLSLRPRRLVCACIPMRVGAEIIGVLELFTLGDPATAKAGRPITQGDLSVLQTFANLAASAIKNAHLYDGAQRSERRLKAFDAVVTAISTAADLTDLVRSILDVVLGLVPGATGALLLLDPAHDRLELGAQQGLSPACAEALARVPVMGSPCEEVVHFGQPMLRPLIEERGEGAFLAEGLAGCAYFPLLAGGTVAGVLALYGDASLPARADREMLLPICNQVGFAVANVRLYADSTSERRKLNTVVTSIAEGVLLCDARGRLTLANEAALTLLRLDSLPFEQRLSEMPDFYRMRDLDGQRLTLDQLPFARALAGEIFQDYRLILSGSSGDETVMSFSGAPARADDGMIEGAVVVFRDVTANQKLERAKDEFLAVAAHELRSPLAAVRNYADLLLRREQQRSQADSRDVRGLTILTQQVSHMLRMVDNLLDVSRIDAGQLDLQIQPVNLVALAAQVIDQQRPAAGARDLVLESADDELIVHCDSLRIHQVLTNLIGNAIKYSPESGRVTVRLRLAAGDDRRQLGDQLLGDDLAIISITDEGSGISPEQQAKLFQRFYRARSHRAEGLGLGLYLSRQFVQMHRGAIWVESVEGSGSAFSFALPMTTMA
ncbi:GAF domain-containing protein [Oscillochloris sp. ZM17-4]|uniref:ATP-binding protein n=1 Tax=Oscillochloris sp. ZM17-4 TaxID=2866714 RepID=UPI001C73730A|nr:ATP-binding protein [Oscillochloris sp. ZM17-4]MBX0330460.1 GAF domain-containing protein [Oscillochloris sp. ZM17-4]